MKTIMKSLSIAVLLVVSGVSFSSTKAPEGYLWYNTKNKKQESATPTIPFEKLSPTKQRDVLVHLTRKSLAKFDVNPTPENALSYIKWQNFWMEKTTEGKRAFQQAMIENPEYNYTSTHPTSTLGLKVSEELKIKQANSVMAKVAKDSGLMFFYRGHNPYDQKQATVLKAFSQRFNIKVLPVSVDGEKVIEYPNSKDDYGQANALKINNYPAIMLFDGKDKKVKPVSFGFVTQDVLSNQLLMVATNYKGDGL